MGNLLKSAMFFACVLFASGCAAKDPKALAESCKSKWKAVSGVSTSGLGADLGKMEAEWRQSEAECSGTGVYEARLSGLFLAEGRFDDAERLLATADSADPEYRARLEVLRARVPLYRDLSREASSAELERKYSTTFAKLAGDDSPYCFTRESAADFYVHTQNYPAAIRSANRALSCDPQSWFSHRALAISQNATGLNAQAVESCEIAKHENEGLGYDPDFMLACAKAFAATGDQEAAEAILTTIGKNVPNVSSLPQYGSDVAYIRSQGQHKAASAQDAKPVQPSK